MKIGIDIDGVITDYASFIIDYGTKYFREKEGKEIVSPDAYEIYDMFNTSRQENEKFWNEAIREYVKVPPRSFASEIINKLKDEGNEIIIITARSSETSSFNGIEKEEMQEIVKEWFEKYNIPYDKLIFSSKYKLEICSNEKIDVMIEDKVKNIESISTIVPVICFDNNYNRNCNMENVIRCYSWNDIYMKLKKLEMQKQK